MSDVSDGETDELIQAVNTAKAFVRKAFGGEHIEHVELEEVKPPDFGTVWQVTIGFNRRRPVNPDGMSLHLAGNAFVQAAAAAAARPPRVYKVVEVDLPGPGGPAPRGLSIMNRKED